MCGRRGKEGHMEENNTQKFLERLKELVALGKKKKGVLELQEVNDFFRDMELNPDQMEKVFDYLENNNVDVLRISPEDCSGISPTPCGCILYTNRRLSAYRRSHCSWHAIAIAVRVWCR